RSLFAFTATASRLRGQRNDIGVIDAHTSKYPHLERFHTLRIVLVLVIVSQKVQYAVYDHMGPVRTKRLTLLSCFAPYDRGAYGEISKNDCRLQGVGRTDRSVHSRKRQDVRGLVLAAPRTVEPTALGGSHDANRQCGRSRKLRCACGIRIRGARP